jgi:hypothetical protein
MKIKIFHSAIILILVGFHGCVTFKGKPSSVITDNITLTIQKDDFPKTIAVFPIFNSTKIGYTYSGSILEDYGNKLSYFLEHETTLAFDRVYPPDRIPKESIGYGILTLDKLFVNQNKMLRDICKKLDVEGIVITDLKSVEISTVVPKGDICMGFTAESRSMLWTSKADRPILDFNTLSSLKAEENRALIDTIALTAEIIDTYNMLHSESKDYRDKVGTRGTSGSASGIDIMTMISNVLGVNANDIALRLKTYKKNLK